MTKVRAFFEGTASRSRTWSERSQLRERRTGNWQLRT